MQATKAITHTFTLTDKELTELGHFIQTALATGDWKYVPTVVDDIQDVYYDNN